MNNAEEQRKAETADQIRSYVYRHCSTMTAQEIATELGGQRSRSKPVLPESSSLIHIHQRLKGDNYNMRENNSVKFHRDSYSFITDR